VKTVSLVGKRYEDTVLFVNGVARGETNNSLQVLNQKGGMHNAAEAYTQDLKLDFRATGSKRAWIVSDRSDGVRTSFVSNGEASSVRQSDVHAMNKESDWVHICYIDDIEEYENLSLLHSPYSLDFCTLKDRSLFLPQITSAAIIFDSRERKALYQGMQFDTPVIFHDASGVEVVVRDEVIYKHEAAPITGLDVNGAGDIYAVNFIRNNFQLNLNESSYCAMLETTEILIKRSNEKI
jgi:hypothetical protein